MRIIGIDPGTQRTGFGVIEMHRDTWEVLDFGCITTTKETAPAIRLQQINEDLASIIQQWKPERGAVEELFFSKNVKTAISVAQARGVVMQTLAHHNIQIREYKPNQVKNIVCGDGNADKKQIQKMVQMLLKLQSAPQPDDAADALAIALCHGFHESSSIPRI